MRKRKNQDLPLFTTRENSGSLPGDLSEADLALLDRLAGVIYEMPYRELSEQTFRKNNDQLHFELRTRFGSYLGAALALAKRELGSPASRDELIAEMSALYEQGRPVTIEEMARDRPRMVQKIVREFGGLDQAWSEAGIDPSTACEDRRWPVEQIFHLAVEVASVSRAGLNEVELHSSNPLLFEAIRFRFGDYSTFEREFTRWVQEQPLLYAFFGRWQLGKLLANSISVTARGTKGRQMPGLFRLKILHAVQPGADVFVVSNLGRLFPVDDLVVPFITPTTDKVGVNYRVSEMVRGENPVAIVSWKPGKGYLALASSRGRIKLLNLSQVKRVRREGLNVMNLGDEDRVAVACFVPEDFARLMVVTRLGRAIAFDREHVRQSSRISMGYSRIRFMEKGDEVASIVAFRDGEDLVLLGRTGGLLRVGNHAILSRKGPSVGRKVWKTPLVAAQPCAGNGRLVIGTKKGRLVCMEIAQVRRTQLQRLGVGGLRLDSDDNPEGIVCLSLSDQGWKE